jgi:hypothetical protein
MYVEIGVIPLVPKIKLGRTCTVSLRMMTVMFEGMQLMHLALLLFQFLMVLRIKPGRT